MLLWFWFRTAMLELTLDCDACYEFIPLEIYVFVPEVRLPRLTCTANWGSLELFVTYWLLTEEWLLPLLFELARDGKFFLVGLTATLFPVLCCAWKPLLLWWWVDVTPDTPPLPPIYCILNYYLFLASSSACFRKCAIFIYWFTLSSLLFLLDFFRLAAIYYWFWSSAAF